MNDYKIADIYWLLHRRLYRMPDEVSGSLEGLNAREIKFALQEEIKLILDELSEELSQ
ncbi:hypothetical protein [Sansalvadorimonas verongulae]|uniref:hypothetical protein n=1 Tax=Sansalvadorimonas verongulae TaxID=2172824 RepID=UPI0012BB5518|nr:hypothetical protein [Sansalvadorimonas verongulae]